MPRAGRNRPGRRWGRWPPGCRPGSAGRHLVLHHLPGVEPGPRRGRTGWRPPPGRRAPATTLKRKAGMRFTPLRMRLDLRLVALLQGRGQGEAGGLGHLAGAQLGLGAEAPFHLPGVVGHVEQGEAQHQDGDHRAQLGLDGDPEHREQCSLMPAPERSGRRRRRSGGPPAAPGPPGPAGPRRVPGLPDQDPVRVAARRRILGARACPELGGRPRRADRRTPPPGAAKASAARRRASLARMRSSAPRAFRPMQARAAGSRSTQATGP